MIETKMETRRDAGSVVVACPDARPPAYQAVIGLGRAGLLQRFLTSSYYDPDGPLATLARRLIRSGSPGWRASCCDGTMPRFPPAGFQLSPASTCRCESRHDSRGERKPSNDCSRKRELHGSIDGWPACWHGAVPGLSWFSATSARRPHFLFAGGSASRPS